MYYIIFPHKCKIRLAILFELELGFFQTCSSVTRFKHFSILGTFSFNLKMDCAVNSLAIFMVTKIIEKLNCFLDKDYLVESLFSRGATPKAFGVALRLNYSNKNGDVINSCQDKNHASYGAHYFFHLGNFSVENTYFTSCKCQ